MEEWKDIQGYEGLYQVSNEGRVKSLERAIKMKHKCGFNLKGKWINKKSIKGYMYSYE